MDHDQPENCAKCGTLPEDILMLTCNHDLCLICSAKNFQKEMQKKGKNANAICCELCGAATVLDESSIYELQKIANSLVHEPKHNKIEDSLNNGSRSSMHAQKHSEFNNRPMEQPRPSLTPSSFDQHSDSISSQFKPSRGYCLEHPDEEISYYCFDCLSSCICPECVIHGTHKNHEVKTIKKAYPIVRAKIEEAMMQLNSKMDELKGLEDKVESHKLLTFDSNKNLKKQIGDMFEELRQKLDRKEKELLTTLDKMLDDSIKEFDGHTKIIKSKASSINSAFEVLHNHFASKEETLLNFYANNHEKMLHSISFEDIPVKKLQECPTFRHSSTFSEVTESINVLQNYINNIGIGATNEKVILKSELANSALTNYNRQLPLHGQSASLNFAKPIAKGPLQNQSQNQLHPSEYRKGENRQSRTNNDENENMIGYGTFGKYPNFMKEQMAIQAKRHLHES